MLNENARENAIVLRDAIVQKDAVVLFETPGCSVAQPRGGDRGGRHDTFKGAVMEVCQPSEREQIA